MIGEHLSGVVVGLCMPTRHVRYTMEWDVGNLGPSKGSYSAQRSSVPPQLRIEISTASGGKTTNVIQMENRNRRR